MHYSPRVWNALLSYLRQDINCRHFKQSLKRHIFRLQSTTAHCNVVFVRLRSSLTYLLTGLLACVQAMRPKSSETSKVSGNECENRQVFYGMSAVAYGHAVAIRPLLLLL